MKLSYKRHTYHYRKRLNFRGPGYFRGPAHENTEVIFVGHEADENEAYFRGPTNIFIGRPTKIRKLFSSVPRPTKMRRIFVGRGHTDENTSLTVFSSASLRPTKIEALHRRPRPSLARFNRVFQAAAIAARPPSPRRPTPPPA
jgi:hypothetical protein